MNATAWIRYFESNRGSYHAPDWGAPRLLPEGKPLDALRRSLAIFQLGETGEGTTLQRYAKKLATNVDFRDYGHALRLFVAEEKVHAHLLELTLTYLGGELAEKQWSHTVFKRARRLVNLEFEIQLFVTAEIIGKVYYALLRRHAGDPILESVCGKLIGDEVKHLNFHIEFLRERLALLGPARRALWRLQFETIFRATRRAVWLDHRPCFLAFGATRSDFIVRTTRGLHSFMADLRSGRSLVPSTLRTQVRPA